MHGRGASTSWWCSVPIAWPGAMPTRSCSSTSSSVRGSRSGSVSGRSTIRPTTSCCSRSKARSPSTSERRSSSDAGAAGCTERDEASWHHRRCRTGTRTPRGSTGATVRSGFTRKRRRWCGRSSPGMRNQERRWAALGESSSPRRGSRDGWRSDGARGRSAGFCGANGTSGGRTPTASSRARKIVRTRMADRGGRWERGRGRSGSSCRCHGSSTTRCSSERSSASRRTGGLPRGGSSARTRTC